MKVEELREEMYDKLNALYNAMRGISPLGKQAFRCVCGRFATVKITVTHPVAGMRTYDYCDHCQPPKLEFDDLAVTTSCDLENSYWTVEDNAWARQMNEQLDGVCF